MTIIKTKAYARAGLIGNPSDGYYGKTISLIVKNFNANVTLWSSPHLEIRLAEDDKPEYRSLDDLVSKVKSRGYYGGKRLIEATIKRFKDYCDENSVGKSLDKNFTLQYDTDIPRLVGLAGSSAIITATLRALMQFCEVDIPKHLQPSLILSVETDELGIGAGLQDRVIQVYEGVVYMHFAKDLLDKAGHGLYEELPPIKLPPLFIAYDINLAEGTEKVHNNLRHRYNNGDQLVIQAMQDLAALAEQARKYLLDDKPYELGPLMDENFRLRKSICDISPRNQLMIDIAKIHGAHAKFAGSSGAAIGMMYGTDFEELKKAYESEKFQVIFPKVI